MTRLARLGPGIVGPKARDAGIVCDDCGYFLRVGKYRLPPVWFLDGKAPCATRRIRIRAAHPGADRGYRNATRAQGAHRSKRQDRDRQAGVDHPSANHARRACRG
jgi:hypothetical protein